MTDESRGTDSESRQRWAKDLQEALDRTSEAVRTAWDATRESRTSALESARQTVKELGQVLEQGMDAARRRWETEGEKGEGWQPAESAPSSPPPPAPTEEPTGDDSSGDLPK